MTRDRFTIELLAWLNVRFRATGVTFTEDTPLFAAGAINSMRILELIAWVERATGDEIPDVRIRMDNFQTVRRIADSFVTGDANVAA